MANGGGLNLVNSVVVLMLENRSFDHMLGYLYYPSNLSATGQAFDGLTGDEWNPGTNGEQVSVFRIEPPTQSDPGTPNAYFMPGSDPGEGYMATNDQLYGSNDGPASSGLPALGPHAVASAT